MVEALGGERGLGRHDAALAGLQGRCHRRAAGAHVGTALALCGRSTWPQRCVGPCELGQGKTPKGGAKVGGFDGRTWMDLVKFRPLFILF